MGRSSLASRLRAARKSLKLSARALDERAGLTPGHTWLIEHGERSDITTDTAKALARALGATLDWLLTGEGAAPSVPASKTGTDD